MSLKSFTKAVTKGISKAGKSVEKAANSAAKVISNSKEAKDAARMADIVVKETKNILKTKKKK